MRRLLLSAVAGLGLLSVPLAEATDLGTRAIDALPLRVLDAAALERARVGLPPRGPRDPARLAIHVPITLDLADGQWQAQSADGSLIWRLRVQAIGATLLTGGFEGVTLPPGAELQWSSIDGEVVQGPYTQRDVDDHGVLWTALVPGDQAMIELKLPSAQRDHAALSLAALGYGVLPLGGNGVPAKAGSCNVDVACPAGDGWRNQIRATVHLQIPGGLFGNQTTLCSGQLVNNLAQNGDPLLLTATHCGVTTGNVRNVTAYYNFQASSCGGVRNGALTQNQRAAQRLFSHARSDHTLLRLDGTPPAAFNAYLSGFNAATQLPQSGVTIHHPSGDEKAISVFNGGSTYSDVVLSGTTTTVDAYRLRWAQGTTEGGSSGGGLWNQQGSLVGLLSAGNASCGNPNGDDFFGRLDLAWQAGLDQFLDPTGTGLSSVTGRNAPGAAGGGGTPAPPGPDPVPSTSGGGGAPNAGGLLLAAGLAGLRYLSARRSRA